jgi:CSLREA domain-containing protein
VTTLEDKDEGYCGANCSLREAIYAANDAVGPAIIKFGVSGTIMLNSLPPYITNKAGVTIDGNGQKVIIQGYKPISSLNDFSRAVFTSSGLTDDSTTDCSPYFRRSEHLERYYRYLQRHGRRLAND